MKKTGVRLKNSLFVKLLAAVGISFLLAYGVLVLISMGLFHFYNQNYLTEFSVAGYNFALILVVVIFVMTFLLLVRKRMIYLKQITDSVHEMANGKLGLTIDIQGRDELSKLAQNINYLSTELESKFEYERQLELSKNELITNVSHDLRSPLTSIIGYLDLLRKGNYSDDQLIDYLDTSYGKSKRLESLINELFEYTHLSSPDVQLDVQETELTGLLEQFIGESIPMFEKERLTVVTSIPSKEIPVRMDVEKMVRVYENLLMNALKYSLRPSDIHISLKAEDSLAILKISNRTEFPPETDPEAWFERFYTGDKARRNHRGTGLGLAISKRIVELHGGHIRAEYKGGWITFSVEHPVT
ncbi:HAMP domain-containing histidine kinase [Rossellomorea sp. SC111]|uniref:HAMP domain-containing sensor histidine kinase n=1 Tax=Rossellomorea sp. SC111 TaxID=2968985 RepID=UPI00215AA78B|nr:HAMP domain-containing histidine kinase [Rossellomorea sp. SC111]MCR8848070.1 HAMP domain-containing histidine kinase [Rossellomorea sp. SC111]